MAQNGGKRPGSGRKKGGMNKKTLEQKALQELYRQKAIERFEPLVTAQLDLAVGLPKIEYYGRGKKKGVRVYHKDPDRGALGDVFDRVLGKPKDGMNEMAEGLAKLGEGIRKILDGKK